MPQALVERTTVQPGGTVHIENRDLCVGSVVQVVVLQDDAVKSPRPTLEILNGGPEKRLFKTAEEVRAYLQEERGLCSD